MMDHFHKKETYNIIKILKFQLNSLTEYVGTISIILYIIRILEFYINTNNKLKNIL